MNRRTRGLVLAGLALALLLAFGGSRFASSQADGLERVAADHALDTGERSHAAAGGPLADYRTRGVRDEGLSTGLAGVIGVVTTFALAGGLVWVAGRAGRRVAEPPSSP